MVDTSILPLRVFNVKMLASTICENLHKMLASLEFSVISFNPIDWAATSMHNIITIVGC